MIEKMKMLIISIWSLQSIYKYYVPIKKVSVKKAKEMVEANLLMEQFWGSFIHSSYCNVVFAFPMLSKALYHIKNSFYKE